MSDAGNIVAEAAAATHSTVVMTAVVTIPVVMVMMIGVMPAPVVGPIRIVPVGVVVPRIAPIGVGIPRVAPIGIPTPIGSPVRTIAPTYVNGRVVVPIEGIIAIDVDVGVTARACVIVVIVVSIGGGLCAETLDSCSEVGIVICLSGGVYHAIRVSHRLSGLVDGIGIVDVILAVGIVGLIVIFRVAADAGAHV
jgi:hypothetical protein